jgi:hypothetical protein
MVPGNSDNSSSSSCSNSLSTRGLVDPQEDINTVELDLPYLAGLWEEIDRSAQARFEASLGPIFLILQVHDDSGNSRIIHFHMTCQQGHKEGFKSFVEHFCEIEGIQPTSGQCDALLNSVGKLYEEYCF